MKETEERLRRLVGNLPLVFMVYQLIRETDGTRRFLYVSPSAERLYGVKPEAILQDASLLYELIAEEDRELLAAEEERSMKEACTFCVEVRSRGANGEMRWIYLSSTPTLLPDGRTLWNGIETDITERKRAEDEREHLIGELRQALQEVQTLKGILPTCAWCKRIRDDNGNWQQFERYIRDRSEAEFSHDICPNCSAKFGKE